MINEFKQNTKNMDELEEYTLAGFLESFDYWQEIFPDDTDICFPILGDEHLMCFSDFRPFMANGTDLLAAQLISRRYAR